MNGFRFRLWPTLLTAIMLPVLLGLGAWQVQRLHWKQNLLATIDARIHQAPVPVVSLANDKDAAYRPATASGLFQHDHVFYLLGVSLNGEGGYHILTPLALDDGRSLLVDRGWVPYDRKNDFFRPIGPVSVAGVLRQPEHRWPQPKNDPARNDWYTIDLDAMAKIAGVPAFLPYVLEADATSNESGYPVGGQTRVTLPNNHLVYAVTWFGLAFALVVIYGLSAYSSANKK